jgi:peptidoglycan/LPS O-acetylase OafA/YrhL
LLASFITKRFFFDAEHLPFLITTYKHFWNEPITVFDLTQQAVLFIFPSSQKWQRLLPQDWTLNVELVVGALLLLLILVIRKKLWLFLFVFVLLWQYIDTYVFEFGAGVFLFHYSEVIKKCWAELHIFLKVSMLLLALLFYSCLFQFGTLFSAENVAFSPM